jgi:hypothetical protein
VRIAIDIQRDAVPVLTLTHREAVRLGDVLNALTTGEHPKAMVASDNGERKLDIVIDDTV